MVLQPFSIEKEALEDPEARLAFLGLPTSGPENDEARRILAGHAAVVDTVLALETDLADVEAVEARGRLNSLSLSSDASNRLEEKG
jgi:hypothetical protein